MSLYTIIDTTPDSSCPWTLERVATAVWLSHTTKIYTHRCMPGVLNAKPSLTTITRCQKLIELTGRVFFVGILNVSTYYLQFMQFMAQIMQIISFHVDLLISTQSVCFPFYPSYTSSSDAEVSWKSILIKHIESKIAESTYQFDNIKSPVLLYY